jgi:hypothetical protein
MMPTKEEIKKAGDFLDSIALSISDMEPGAYPDQDNFITVQISKNPIKSIIRVYYSIKAIEISCTYTSKPYEHVLFVLMWGYCKITYMGIADTTADRMAIKMFEEYFSYTKTITPKLALEISETFGRNIQGNIHTI